MSPDTESRQRGSYPSIRLVGRLSDGAWELSSSLPGAEVWLRAPKAFLKLVRPGRVLMLTLLTWVCGAVVRLTTVEHWLVVAGGALLAMAGFALDFYADREADAAGPRAWPVNPVSAGIISANAARILIVVFLFAGILLCGLAHPLTLLPAGGLLLIYLGLASGVLDGPVGRAVTLGALQALYVLLAAAATGTMPAYMVGVASVLLVAMIGARAVADIRDLPSDKATGTRTLAKVYGMRVTSWILPICVSLATLISLWVYRLGVFDADYLIWSLLCFVPGLVLAWGFPFRPTPNYAFILAYPYWFFALLYMAALYTGSR